ncbi:hypothetical protein M9Y10_039133 [Tritrichomonas musculus]|uniref:BEACH domain-containing protein n=1 Tax=Tritrichomonas musculus TaxID=1915356 RepID=A0ABR2KB14_9EUKA
MKSSLHPIAAIFNLCHTEKNTIASKASLSQIKGHYQFDRDEINMLSVQLFNGLQISKIIPEKRFTVKFNSENLRKILNQGRSSHYVLLLLFSSISWLIEAERSNNITNFGLVLDILDSVSPQIPTIYQVTNYFYISIFKLNADTNFQDVEQQTKRFCEKYKKNANFIDNTILLWLQIAYSFPVQTVFSQNILMFTAQFYQENQHLFTEDQINSLCFILNPKFSKLDRNALCFLIEIANILPLNSIYETTTYLIDSIQTVLEGTDVIYEIFDKTKYQQTISFEKPRETSSSIQYPSKEAYYSDDFLLPQFPFDLNFRISPTIKKMTNYISKVLISSSVPPNKFCSNLVALLQTSLKSPHFFDYVASVLSILIFVESIDVDTIFKVLIDSPLFDPQITIFTKNSEKECVHKLRMLSYRYIIFPNPSNCKLFFKMMKYPLLISEFFFYAVRMHIHCEILKNHSFIHYIYVTIIYYRQLDINNKKKLEGGDAKIKVNDSFNIDIFNEDGVDDEELLEMKLKINETKDSLNNPEPNNDSNSHQFDQKGNSSDINKESGNVENDNEKSISNQDNNESNNDENSKKDNIIDDSNKVNITDENNHQEGIDDEKINNNNNNEEAINEDNNNNENLDNEISNEENTNNENINKETTNDETNSKENEIENVDDANKDVNDQTEINSTNENESNLPPNTETVNIEEEEEDVENEKVEQSPTSSLESTKKEIIKVIHRKPLPYAKNNFIKWFLQAYKDNCPVQSPEQNAKENLDDIVYIHCVLVYILAFIIKTLQADASVSLIWNESAILPAIFSLIFDECLRPIILKILRTIWEVDISDTTINSQSHILTIFQQNYDEEFALLDLQLLEAINKELTNFPHINRQSFSLLCPVITSILVNCDISSEFLHNAMRFFSFVPNEVKRATRTAIVAAMQKTEGKEPDRRFFTDFVLLITDDTNIKESPDYLIRMPTIVSIFIEAFLESPLLNEVLQFVDSLCQRSFANSFACHQGKVDLILLKFIGTYSDMNSQEEKTKSINDILPALSLLSKISLRASSMPVVNTFISLFCQIKSNFVPPYISELTQTLRNIIVARQLQPIAYYPISLDSPIVNILRLTGNQIKQGFTFIMNIYIDPFSQDYKPRIFSLSDKKQVLKVGISKRQIYIYGFSVPEVLFSCQIPLNSWTKVAISFYPPKKIVECHIENQSPSVQPYNLNDFQNGLINCHFGGGSRASPTVLHAINIGSFAIYPYINDVNFKVLEFQNTPIISVTFENDQSLLRIRKKSSSDVDATLIGPNVIVSLSLPDVLIRFFKAQILIPLFAQVDLPIYGTLDNELLPSSFLASILNLLSSTLQLSIDAQQSFEQSSGFRIIAYLLTSNSPRNLTFDLYLHFVLLYESIHLPELKLQLFQYILTNAQIWALTSQKVCQQILDHWDQHLFTKYTDTFLSVLPFSRLINVFSHFYWRTSRKARKSTNENEETLEYGTRTIIFQIFCKVAEKQFTMNDLIALFMSCVGSPDMQFSEDLLLMIRLLAQSNHSPFKNINNKDILFFTLHFLLSCYNEKIALSTIDTILALHSSQLFQESFVDVFMHIELIMINIKEVFYTESFVAGLLKMCYSHPEVLPIPFYIASTCSDQSSGIITNIINNIHPSNEFGIGKLWFLWPLVTAIKFKDYLDFIMNFIIMSSSARDWTSIYATIEIVALALNNDPIPLQRAFLLDLGRAYISGQRVPNVVNLNNSNSQSSSSLLNGSASNNIGQTASSNLNDPSDTYNEIEEFVELCQYFIISKPIDKKSLALHVAYAISPFIEGNELDLVSFDSVNQISSAATNCPFKFFEGGEFFTSKIIEMSQKNSIQRKFLLDLNEKGQWNDEKLSKTVIQIITKFNVDKFTSLAIGLSPRQNPNSPLQSENDYNPNSPIQGEIDYHPNCEKLHEIFETSNDSINRLNLTIPSQSLLIVENRRKAITTDSNLRLKYLDNIYNEIVMYVNDEDRRVTANHDESSKLWIHLWRQLTVDRAPWRNALPMSSTHFKRNRRILAYFAPVKLKRNMDFNEHKDASFNRDIGSGDLSKKRFEEHLNELEIQYRKEAPPPLLELKNEFSEQEELNKTANATASNVVINVKEKSQNYKAKLLTLGGQKDVTFCLMRRKIQIIDNKENKVKNIDASEVTHFLFRSFLHHERSFEIILKNGKSYLIDLLQAASLDLLKIVSKLSAFEHALVQTVHFKEFVQSINIQAKWCNGYISNFEYLMQLNFFGGRTFNELALYPVFPWIFSNYSSSTIDLTIHSNFRDFSKPMGAMTEKRLNELLKHVKDFMAIRTAGFLYSSCYISPLTVILLLIRMEPFTTLHIQLQSGKFDHAARVFASIPSAYRMATTHNNDYRELIPEFFYTSSFLENRNNFDLGKVNSVDVNDVSLPKWSKSAIDFVYIHRKALESDYVSEHLNDWIDLIFGHKQKGQKAVEANNTFDPCLYENIWTKENLNDPSKRAMIEALLQHCGHIPNQLFTQPHPPKKKFVVTPLISSSLTFSTGVICSVFTNFYVKQNSLVRCLYCTREGKILLASTDLKEINWSMIGLDSYSQNSPSISPQQTNTVSSANSPFRPNSAAPYRVGMRRKTLILGKFEEGSTPVNAPAKIPSSPSIGEHDTAIRRSSMTSFSFASAGGGSSNGSGGGPGNGGAAGSGTDDDCYYVCDVDLSMTTPNKFDKFAFYPKLARFILATDTGVVQVTDFSIASGGDSFSGKAVKKEASVSLFQHIGRVNCVSVSENFIVSGGSDTIINVWENPNKPLSNCLPSSKTTVVTSLSPSIYSAIIPGSLSSSTVTTAASTGQSIDQSSSPDGITSPSSVVTSPSVNASPTVDGGSVGPDPSSMQQSSSGSPPSSNFVVKHLKSIQSFRSEITCTFINEKFGTIACGTNDGSVLLIDTASLISTVAIDIAPETPVRVHITPGWGFVVVYSTKVVDGRILNFISLFDIDGQFIRKKELSYNISAWTVYMSIDGFDYMAIANDAGCLFLCEAFYLDLEEACAPKNSSKIVALKYIVSQGILLAARENGAIDTFSENILNTKRFNRTVFGIEK